MPARSQGETCQTTDIYWPILTFAMGANWCECFGWSKAAMIRTMCHISCIIYVYIYIVSSGTVLRGLVPRKTVRRAIIGALSQLSGLRAILARLSSSTSAGIWFVMVSQATVADTNTRVSWNWCRDHNEAFDRKAKSRRSCCQETELPGSALFARTRCGQQVQAGPGNELRR